MVDHQTQPSIRYAVGAQEVSKRYTEISIETAKRIETRARLLNNHKYCLGTDYKGLPNIHNKV